MTSLPKAALPKGPQAVSTETNHTEAPTGLCIGLWLAAESYKALLGPHPTTHVRDRPLWDKKGVGSNYLPSPYHREMRPRAIQLGIFF